MKQYIQLVKEQYPNAVILIREILTHSCNQLTNDGSEQLITCWKDVHYSQWTYCRICSGPFSTQFADMIMNSMTKVRFIGGKVDTPNAENFL